MAGMSPWPSQLRERPVFSAWGLLLLPQAESETRDYLGTRWTSSYHAAGFGEAPGELGCGPCGQTGRAGPLGLRYPGSSCWGLLAPLRGGNRWHEGGLLLERHSRRSPSSQWLLQVCPLYPAHVGASPGTKTLAKQDTGPQGQKLLRRATEFCWKITEQADEPGQAEESAGLSYHLANSQGDSREQAATATL